MNAPCERTFDNLKGRALDAAVARHVFGHAVEARTNSRTGAEDFVYALSPGQWANVPNYGSSMASSIQLEVELQDRGWARKGAPSDSVWNGASDVRVVLEHTDGRRVEAVGAPSEALCRASLKALNTSDQLPT